MGSLNTFQFNGTRGVTYYIKIVPYNPNNNLTDCPIMSFEGNRFLVTLPLIRDSYVV